MTCLWTSLAGVQTDCSTDEFWLDMSGDPGGGILPYWGGVPILYRMSVVRSPDGQVLNYAPSLSVTQPILDWAASDGGEYAPGISGGPSESSPLSNEWLMMSSPFGQSGILTIQGAGSRAFTILTFSAGGYIDISYEVIWA